MDFDGLVTNEPTSAGAEPEPLPEALVYGRGPKVAERLRTRLEELIRPYDQRDELSPEESCELSILYALIFLGNRRCEIMTAWNDFVVPFTPVLRDAQPDDEIYKQWWSAFVSAVGAIQRLIGGAEGCSSSS